MASVTDGTTNTFLIGETLPEFCEFQRYNSTTGQDPGWAGGNSVAQGQTIQPLNWQIDRVAPGATPPANWSNSCTFCDATNNPSPATLDGRLFSAAMVERFFDLIVPTEADLLTDLIPFVESKYPVKTGRENRALAGLSMGGGQALNFGLGHPDTFAWVGGFSSAPNTKPPADLLADPAAAKGLKLLWVSCGDKDGLMNVSQRTHAYLKEKGVPHVWHVPPGGHDFGVWKQDLYHFSQRLFR